MQAKDGRTYWTDPNKPTETSFLLGDIPDDGRMVVDGHSTSAIFADEHQDLIVGGLKLGIVDPESGIEQLPFQNKDTLLARLRMKEQKQAQLLGSVAQAGPGSVGACAGETELRRASKVGGLRDNVLRRPGQELLSR